MSSIPQLRFCAGRALAVMFFGVPMVAVAATSQAEALFFRRVRRQAEGTKPKGSARVLLISQGE